LPAAPASLMCRHPLRHIFVSAPPVLFPDGEIFLSTASIDLEGTKIEWGIPDSISFGLKNVLKKIEQEDLESVPVHLKLAAEIDELLGFKTGMVQWRMAVEFNYTKDEISILEDEPAVYNKNVSEDSAVIRTCRQDQALEIFLSQPACAAVIEDNEVASLCWDGGNRAVSIATKDRYRNMGFGSSCLRVLTKQALDDGKRLSIGTGIDDNPLIHIAEKIGYELTNRMYWISIPAGYRELIPAHVDAELSDAQFTGNV
jgi:hypothetical protein